MPYQRRSYAIDNSRQNTLNRTSTPYDQSAATKPAMNDSINGISEIDANSPRYDRLETRYVLGKFRDTTEKLHRSATFTTFCSCRVSKPNNQICCILGVAMGPLKLYCITDYKEFLVLESKIPMITSQHFIVFVRRGTCLVSTLL